MADLNEYLTQADRLLVIYGMTGIGKTTLAERLAADCWEREEFRYVQVDCDRDLGVKTFNAGAISILAKLGDDTAQQLPDDQILPYLVKSLQGCWVQLDSLEALLVPTVDGAMRFADGAWLDFLEQILRSSLACRLILTSQTLPQDWDDRGVRLNRWRSYRLAGLMQAERLDLFRQYGLAPQTEAETDRLCDMAAYFEGHPLILKMIAGDIQNPPFRGNIQRYWQDYYQPRRQPNSSTPPLRRSQEDKARTWVQQTLAQLPDTAQQLLQWGSVFRRSVPEAFYAQLLPDLPTAALTLLLERNLLEDDHFQGGLLRQHNLIREVARAALQANREAWQIAERQAANLWLTQYEPPVDAPNLEKVRGYLEAFEHFCAVEDWDAASTLYVSETQPNQPVLHWQLMIWAYYQDLIRISAQLVNHISSQTKRLCLNQLGNCYSRLGNIDTAITYYQQALEFTRATGDKQGEGRCFICLGNAYQDLGQYQQCINYFEQALPIAHELNDIQAQSAALGNLGLAYNSLGNYEKAIDFHQQYLTIAREIGDRASEGCALGNLGNAYYSLGNYEKAIDFYQQYLTIAREIGDRRGEGNALGSLGNAYNSLGNSKKAIDFHQQCLNILREIGDRRGEGAALGCLGNAYDSLGNYEKAIDLYQQRLTIAREIGDRRGEGNALGGLGSAYYSLGNSEKAIDFHQQHLTIAREIGDRRGEGNALGSLGNAYDSLGNSEKAIDFHQQHLSIAREIGDRSGEAIALGNLGNAYCSLGNYPEALDLQTQKLAIAREIHSRQTESYALSGLGEVFIKLEQYEEALKVLQDALEICEETGERSLHAEVLKNLAELHQAFGEMETARQYCQQALSLATELGIPLKAECEALQLIIDN